MPVHCSWLMAHSSGSSLNSSSGISNSRGQHLHLNCGMKAQTASANCIQLVAWHVIMLLCQGDRSTLDPGQFITKSTIAMGCSTLPDTKQDSDHCQSECRYTPMWWCGWGCWLRVQINVHLHAKHNICVIVAIWIKSCYIITSPDQYERSWPTGISHMTQMT